MISPGLWACNRDLAGGGQCANTSEDECLPLMLTQSSKTFRMVRARHLLEGSVNNGAILRKFSIAFLPDAAAIHPTSFPSSRLGHGFTCMIWQAESIIGFEVQLILRFGRVLSPTFV